MKVTTKLIYDAMVAGLSDRAIREKYGIAARTLRYHKMRITRRGYSPAHDMTHTVPDGYAIKGVSTMYDGKGNVRAQWVKSQSDAEQQREILIAAVQAMSSELPKAEPIPLNVVNRHGNPNLVNLFILTDYHLGMLSWGEETGADWDMKIAEDTLVAWFAAAIKSAPSANTAVLAQLGDFLHWDGLDAVTPSSGHVLDADTRFQKLVRVAIRALRRIVRMLLEKFGQVHVINAEGNHDMASSIWLRELMYTLYEDEPRVTVDRNPDPYYCYEFGDVSLFFHHGHKRKAENLQVALMAKFREVFGRTRYSYAHVGHLHHLKSIESPVMVVEQHRTLAAKDAYASRGGWLSQRSAAVITYHAQYGEVSRITITPEMLR